MEVEIMLFNETTVINEKSFENYKFGQPVQKASIMFGTNGSGKSSFCKSLMNQYKNGIRLFDTKYVNSNIQFPTDIKGSPLLTREQKQKKDAIKQLQDEKSAKEVELSKNKEDLNKERCQLFTIMTTKLNEGKELFDKVKINQKAGSKDEPEKMLQYWFKDAEKKTESTGNESLKELKAKSVTLKQECNKIIPIQIGIYTNSLNSIQELLKSPYTKPNESLTAEIIEWIKQGERIHDLSGAQARCLFCGNTFDVNDVAGKIKKRINNKYSLAIQQVSDISKSVSSLKKEIAAAFADSTYENEKKTALLDCDKLLDCIRQKQKDMQAVMDINADKLISDVRSLSSGMKQGKDDRSHEINRIEQINKNKEEEAKSWIGKQLKEDRIVNYLEQSIKKTKDRIKTLKCTIADCDKKISDAEKASSSMQPFEILANRALQATGADFRLQLQEDDTFQVLSISENQNSPRQKKISPQDLSEGEVRLLGFIHFMLSLYKTTEVQDFKDEIQLILIDDPITSLDMDNRYYITEEINKIITDVYNNTGDLQLIVLTHSSMDSHNIGYQMKDITRLEICKDYEGKSSIKTTQFSQNRFSDYYASVFHELIKFATANNHDVTSFTPYLQYPAKMRFVFETHARTHYKLSYTTKHVIQNLCKCYETPDNPTFKMQFSNSLDLINSLTHGLSFLDEPVNESSPREVRDAIRIIIYVLYNKDKEHVRAMCADDENWSKLRTILNQLDNDFKK